MKKDFREPVHIKGEKASDAMSREEEMMRRSASQWKSKDAISEEEKIRKINEKKSRDPMRNEE